MVYTQFLFAQIILGTHQVYGTRCNSRDTKLLFHRRRQIAKQSETTTVVCQLTCDELPNVICLQTWSATLSPAGKRPTRLQHRRKRMFSSYYYSAKLSIVALPCSNLSSISTDVPLFSNLKPIYWITRLHRSCKNLKKKFFF